VTWVDGHHSTSSPDKDLTSNKTNWQVIKADNGAVCDIGLNSRRNPTSGGIDKSGLVEVSAVKAISIYCSQPQSTKSRHRDVRGVDPDVASAESVGPPLRTGILSR
jgi:hypothetical protein